MTIKTFVFFTLILALTAFSQEPVKATVDSISTEKKDTVDLLSTVSTVDSLSVSKNTVAADSISTEKPADKLNKRNYNHREQIIFGAAMMAFFAVILTTVQNMNPD